MLLAAVVTVILFSLPRDDDSASSSSSSSSASSSAQSYSSSSFAAVFAEGDYDYAIVRRYLILGFVVISAFVGVLLSLLDVALQPRVAVVLK